MLNVPMRRNLQQRALLLADTHTEYYLNLAVSRMHRDTTVIWRQGAPEDLKTWRRSLVSRQLPSCLVDRMGRRPRAPNNNQDKKWRGSVLYCIKADTHFFGS